MAVTCKDCLTECIDHPEALVGRIRPAPYPGPRCATHHREAVKARRLRAQEKRVRQVYNLPPETYDRIYLVQGGKCDICRRATGARKRLAVDHDHSCCNGPTSCGKCVRGLLCGTCNKIVGHFRDDPDTFERGATYLTNWPSRRLTPV